MPDPRRWYWRCDLCDASGFFDLPATAPGVGRAVLEAQLAHERRVPACVSTAQRAAIGRMPEPAIAAGWA
jgi:hypothetical protein